MILKFADETAILRIVGLIKKKNEPLKRSEVCKFVLWCKTNYLLLNVNKTKGVIIGSSKKDTKIMPLKMNDQFIEKSFYV